MRKTIGFTLVEMLVVIVVVIILAAILFPAMTAMRNKSLGEDTKSDLRKIDAAIRQYENDIGHYPLYSPYWEQPGGQLQLMSGDPEGAPGWTDGDEATDMWEQPEGNSRMLYDELYSGYLEGDLGCTASPESAPYYQYFVDVWDNPFVYVYKLPATFGDSSARNSGRSYMHNGDPSKPYKKWCAPSANSGFGNEFELWSAGADEKYDSLRGDKGDNDNLTVTPYKQP